MTQVSIIVTILITASQALLDECEVSRCGDICLKYVNVNCQCGKDLFQVDSEEKYCCISTNDTCSYVDTGRTDWYQDTVYDGFCGEGEMYPMSRHCNNTARRLQCHNSYQDSLEIGEQAHYTCPHTCVSVRQEMCRGINWCAQDYQECDEDLRCYRSDDRKTLNSSLVPGHHYCIDSGANVNDGIIDAFDRSDEVTYSSSVGTSYEIDSSLFEPCKVEFSGLYPDPGLMCGPDCIKEDIFCITDLQNKNCFFGDVICDHKLWK